MGNYKSDIQTQMESDRNRKQQQIERDRQMGKTHFGPEETPDRAQAFIDKEKRNRETVKTWLDIQIQVSVGLKSAKESKLKNSEGAGEALSK